MASRLNITQSAYSQYEKSSHLRKATREKIALALGIHATQLDFYALRKKRSSALGTLSILVYFSIRYLYNSG
nr:hypothetical protein [Histophilus somni]